MFEPNWASPPGDTISRLATAGNLSVHDLAERIGFEEDVFSRHHGRQSPNLR